MAEKSTFEVVAVDRETGEERIRVVLAASEDAAREVVINEGLLAGRAIAKDPSEPPILRPQMRRRTWVLVGVLAGLTLTEGGLRIAGGSLLFYISKDAKMANTLRELEKSHDKVTAIVKDRQTWARDGRGARDAWAMIQKHARDRLKSPTSAVFPVLEALEEEPYGVVWSPKDRSFLMSAYVDSANSYGTMIRTRFVAELATIGNGKPTRPEDPEAWVLKQFTFDE